MFQHQIDEMKATLVETRDQGAATDAKLEAVAEVIEGGGIGQSRAQSTFLGGYGELKYNNLDAVDSSKDLEQIDLHRFVMFLGRQFNDSVRFYSELEGGTRTGRRYRWGYTRCGRNGTGLSGVRSQFNFAFASPHVSGAGGYRQ